MRGGKLITVDREDRPLGVEDELLCHRGEGILHRAFTILIIDGQGDLLVQRRSESKLLWPLFWEASCSGHPRVGEDMVEAAEKRLREELGFKTAIQDVGRFIYHAAYKNAGSEWEVCHLLAGRYDGEVLPVVEEVAEVRRVAPALLRAEIEPGREKYAPWLEPALELWIKVVE